MHTQAAIWLAITCVCVVDACFALAGSSALYETSPLQRQLRDLHVVAQHYDVQQRHYVKAGNLFLGVNRLPCQRASACLSVYGSFALCCNLWREMACRASYGSEEMG